MQLTQVLFDGTQHNDMRQGPPSFSWHTHTQTHTLCNSCRYCLMAHDTMICVKAHLLFLDTHTLYVTHAGAVWWHRARESEWLHPSLSVQYCWPVRKAPHRRPRPSRNARNKQVSSQNPLAQFILNSIFLHLLLLPCPALTPIRTHTHVQNSICTCLHRGCAQTCVCTCRVCTHARKGWCSHTHTHTHAHTHTLID